MPAPQEVVELVDRFQRNRDAYRSGRYNETQLRQEFVNPLFELLGWDVNNRQGFAEQYKDVVHEDRIAIGFYPKAPDYAFRIGGARKFFVETKTPSKDLKGDPEPAFQLRRYAWSAKLPLSILTDFEEFAVYDCRIKPAKGDKASVARIMYLTSAEYVERWDDLAAIFAREAVLKGSFDAYAESKKKKRGTAEVDEAFLGQIEAWRELLAKNLALRNENLGVRELNFAVQRIIDRIVFLRICEDRGIEQYGQLQALLNAGRVYARLGELFHRADQRYNSGLFHFRKEKGRNEPPDELTLGLDVDDKALKDIIGGLYYPESPYEFSVLPADILGQVYERFLGKVIRLTAGHQAKVEEKPEVRKAGGVYYTPTYIVEYIVQQTVGKLLEEAKTPKKAADLKILDPACGSGSFLIGAYQKLLDWHLEWYVKDGAEKHAKGRDPKLFQGLGGEWRLTTAEKRRILTKNIFGVDIDPQAVEVTKLSLLLKVLEGESAETLASQLRLFHERALPDLGSNIKCGNSLIGSDFYDDKQMDLLDEEERYRVNVFDWPTEFSGIFSAPSPGFTAVIGNPPYVLLQDEFRDDEQLAYFRSKYSVASYKIDTYHLFIERTVRIACSGGRCSLITPANFLTNNHLVRLRRLLLEGSNIDHVLVVDGGVFTGVSVDNAVYVTTAGGRTSSFAVRRSRLVGQAMHQYQEETVSASAALRDPYALFTSPKQAEAQELWTRLENRGVVLGEIAHVNFGKQLRDRKKFPKDVIKVQKARRVRPPYRPCYTGKDVVGPYQLNWGGLACLDREIARRGGCWDSDKQDAKRKLLTRQIGQYPGFAIDELGFQCLNTMFMINVHDDRWDAYALLGVLNSRLVRELWLDKYYDRRRTFPKIKGTYLKKLPLPLLPSDAGMTDRLAQLVRHRIELSVEAGGALTDHGTDLLRRQIAATDRQIDQLVYELYGLTDDEIRIVEKATDRS